MSRPPASRMTGFAWHGDALGRIHQSRLPLLEMQRKQSLRHGTSCNACGVVRSTTTAEWESTAARNGHAMFNGQQLCNEKRGGYNQE